MFTNREKKALATLIKSLTGNEFNTVKNSAYSKISYRMKCTGCNTLTEYLHYCAEINPIELNEFISSITVHMTSWFREMYHFEFLHKYLQNKILLKNDMMFTIWSVACSTGQEVYSLALYITALNDSLGGQLKFRITGTDIDPKSLAEAKSCRYDISGFIPFKEKYKSYIRMIDGKTFTLDEKIRSKCSFEICNLVDEEKSDKFKNFDLIMARNILIYFSQEQVGSIASDLSNRLKPNGLLITGLSEPIHFPFLEKLDKSVYKVNTEKSKSIAKHADDLLNNENSFDDSDFAPNVIIIGSSTGGPLVLKEILSDIGNQFCPPIVIAQHIEANYSRLLAEDIAKRSKLQLNEITDGLALKPGHIYMATEKIHFGISLYSGQLIFKTKEKIDCSHWPCIDHLFASAAISQIKTLSILLTGMGDDGAYGLKKLKENGHITIVQDKESSVVFGMPKVAIQNNAQVFIGNPKQIRERIDLYIRKERLAKIFDIDKSS